MEDIQEEKQELVIPKESFVFVPLGGITGIGQNFFLYGYKNKWLIVDCGIGFADEKNPGVDVLLPDPTFISERKKDIVGMVITHGHEDHIGAIPYLWRDLNCPIYATPFASALIEDALDEAGLLGRVDLNVVDENAHLELKPFTVDFLPVNHSIPEPNMLVIRTKVGTVVHSGDWKFETPTDAGVMDVAALKKLGKEGVLALVSDSTNIFKEQSDVSEKDVCQTLTELFSHYRQKIVVSCFASNVARIHSIYDAAQANGRKVCLMGRSLWRIDSAARSVGYLKDVPEFLTEEEAEELPENKVVYICTGSQGEPYSALSKLASPKPLPNQIILRQGDVVIFSSRVIPGNELAINALQKRLMMTGCSIVSDKDALVHVSGHSAQDNIKKLYEYLKPAIAIPVHGEPLSILEHKKLATQWGAGIAMTIEEGDVLELNDGDAEILGEVPVGTLAVDGKKIISLGADVIRKRRKMIEGGTVVLTVVVNRDCQMMGVPQVSDFGLLDEIPESKEKLFEQIRERIENATDKERQDDVLLKEAVRLTVRHFISEEYGKKPLLEIHLFKI